MGRSIDTLPKNTLWSTLLYTSLTTTPASAVTGLAAIWIPWIRPELGMTAALLAFIGLGTGVTASCWIVDDPELNTYRRLGPEGRAEIRKEVVAREKQIRIAIKERELGYSDSDGRFDEKRALPSHGSKRNNDDNYWGSR